MKIIQMCLFLALVTTIVTEDKYVVAKLPAGALANNGEEKPENDYWARAGRPNRYKAGTPRRPPMVTRPPKDLLGKILHGIYNVG